MKKTIFIPSSESFIKRYSYHVLLSSERERALRMGRIEEYTQQRTPVTFIHEGHVITRVSKRVMGKRARKGEMPISAVGRFAESLDEMHALRLVHGDINRKNILQDDSGELHLIDFEPDTRQLIEGRSVLMGTIPWICEYDQACDTLSVNTDLLGFAEMVKPRGAHYYRSTDWKKLLRISLESQRPFQRLLEILHDA